MLNYELGGYPNIVTVFLAEIGVIVDIGLLFWLLLKSTDVF